MENKMATAVSELPELLTEDEAAKILKQSKVNLWRERKAGRISYKQIGRRGIRYTPADLAEYLERQARPATAAAAA